MAKYTINHKCGHSEVVELYGKQEDRYRKIEYMESIDCPECRRKAEYERALSLSSELPVLEGSEKQIAWAMSIRQNWIDNAKKYFERNHMDYQESLEKLLSGYKADPAKYDMDPERKTPMSDVWKVLLAHIETKAVFFINNR